MKESSHNQHKKIFILATLSLLFWVIVLGRWGVKENINAFEFMHMPRHIIKSKTTSQTLAIGFRLSDSIIPGVTIKEAFIVGGHTHNSSPSDCGSAKRRSFSLQAFEPLVRLVDNEPTEVGVRIQATEEELWYPSFDYLSGRPRRFAAEWPADNATSRIAPLLGKQCPTDRFVAVNTRRWGRHHNQLQELMNLVAWSNTLNRTLVLLPFVDNKKWVDVGFLYNFTEIMKRYCVVTVEVAKSLIKHRHYVLMYPVLSVRCIGLGLTGTPLADAIGLGRCTKGELPNNFPDRVGMKQTQGLAPSYFSDNHGLLVLSAQVAFYLRPGVWDLAMAFRHLHPSLAVGKALDVELTSLLPPNRTGTASGAISTYANALPYFSIQSRSREDQCLREIAMDKEDGFKYLYTMAHANLCNKDNNATHGANSQVAVSPAQWQMAKWQCNMTSHGVNNLLSKWQKASGNKTLVRLFFASDGQNKLLSAFMSSKGAHSIPSSKYHPLIGVTVDYFLLSSGLRYTGNQLSSVSQNVCYTRLARGLTCDGWYPIWSLYHARNVLSYTV